MQPGWQQQQRGPAPPPGYGQPFEARPRPQAQLTSYGPPATLGAAAAAPGAYGAVQPPAYAGACGGQCGGVPTPQQRRMNTPQSPSSGESPRPMTPVAAKAVPLNKRIFMVLGLTFLVLLSFLPIWDAISMLHNMNYAFWGHRDLPVVVIVVSILIWIFFVFTTEAVFGRWKNELHTTQSLIVMASLFITLLGLVLVLVSLPVSQRAIETHNNILYQCASSPQTHHLRMHYLQLLAVRRQPACRDEWSVENCPGYKEDGRNTHYLKDLESHYRCTGFCYKTQSFAAAANATAFPELDSSKGSTFEFPPTLFSKAKFDSSCDGAAARNLLNFTRDTGYEWWYMGVFLLGISICMGLWEWSAEVNNK